MISFLAMTVLVQALWGGFPSAVRYLLVYASPALKPATLLAVVRTMSMLILSIAQVVPYTGCHAPARKSKTNGEFLARGERLPLNPTASNASSKTTYELKFNRFRLFVMFGWFTALNHLLNVLSCYYAPVYMLAFVKLLSPILTPLADSYFLGATLHDETRTAVLMTTVGCGLMLCGEINGDGVSTTLKSGATVGVVMQVNGYREQRTHAVQHV